MPERDRGYSLSAMDSAHLRKTVEIRSAPRTGLISVEREGEESAPWTALTRERKQSVPWTAVMQCRKESAPGTVLSQKGTARTRCSAEAFKVIHANEFMPNL